MTRQLLAIGTLIRMTSVSEVSAEDWQLWRAFGSMYQQLSRALDRRLQQDAGISQADYVVMMVLSENPDRRLRPVELGERLSWEKSRVSHQVARMESRGLVERIECATDGRGTWVSLTAEGRRTLLSATRDHAAAIREYFFDEIGTDEKATIGRAAERVLDKLNPDLCREARE